MALDTSDFRNGLKIDLDGSPYVITYFQHVKPGKGGAFVRTKVKNLLNGKSVDKTFRSGEKLKEADVEERTMQYLYKDGEDRIFMDSKNFDQIPITDDVIGDNAKFLLENAEVDVLFWKGNPVNIELPSFVEVVITQSDPGVKGDTSSGATKPATLETGAVIQVPLFLKEGEKVRVDTRTGEYCERVN
ncbi:MAG: elongation factor P [Deltaproteobacteria bacterium]|nr:elongation factor P [Deltaproteobacteria bacterium]MBW2724288.1 elongation factor P [Deltaproteobacteria bacterium]